LNSNEELEDIFNMAFTNAITHGCGVIRVFNTPTGLQIDVVEPEEYLDLGLALQWAAENSPPRLTQ
jgi:hypothetical protein